MSVVVGPAARGDLPGILSLLGASVLPPDGATPLREGISRTVSWYMRQGWL